MVYQEDNLVLKHTDAPDSINMMKRCHSQFTAEKKQAESCLQYQYLTMIPHGFEHTFCTVNI